MFKRSLSPMARIGALAWSICAVCGSANAQPVPGDGAPPITHAALMQELQALKSVGFDVNDENYPNSLQQSSIRLAAKRQAGAGPAAPGQPSAPPSAPPAPSTH